MIASINMVIGKFTRNINNDEIVIRMLKSKFRISWLDRGCNNKCSVCSVVVYHLPFVLNISNLTVNKYLNQPLVTFSVMIYTYIYFCKPEICFIFIFIIFMREEVVSGVSHSDTRFTRS